MSGSNVLWVEKDFSVVEKIFGVGKGFFEGGRGSFEVGKEKAFFLQAKVACGVKLKSSLLWVTEDVLGEVNEMFFSTVAIVTSVEMPTTSIQVIYMVKYNLIETETALVTEVA